MIIEKILEGLPEEYDVLIATLYNTATSTAAQELTIAKVTNLIVANTEHGGANIRP